VSVSCLGMGNGAVFQLVPQKFRNEIGIATGVIGAAGGIGGFLLPTLLGSVKQMSGSYSAGMVVLALCALSALVILRLLVLLQKGWQTNKVEISEGLQGEVA
jgi:MFS transporter, NNP family, nitrate/nitrite transporter